MTMSTPISFALLALALTSACATNSNADATEPTTTADQGTAAPEAGVDADPTSVEGPDEDIDGMTDEDDLDDLDSLDEADAQLDPDATIGSGGGGGSGSGYGRGSGSGFDSGRKVPRVKQAQASVHGSLDKDIIRRIVRAHINEVRSCYSAGLAKDPDLNGQVTVEFVIGADGLVGEAQPVNSDDFQDQEVVECIAKAAESWKFPKPQGGGKVIVTYPFDLEPG